MAKIIKPPQSFKKKDLKNIKSVFLAGSIEMGVAEKWQEKVENILNNKNIIILNPRRDEWDSTWSQDIKNTLFREQVEWELKALEMADIIIMYFSPQTQSPVSLLEFGLYARSNKLIVCCPEGFWKKGNIDIVCKKYQIKQVESIEMLINEVKSLI